MIPNERRGQGLPPSYTPASPPTIPGGEMQYIYRELTRLAEVIRYMQRLWPQVAFSEPENPLEGMIRIAKDPWRPNGVPDEVVIYKGNGVWAPLGQ